MAILRNLATANMPDSGLGAMGVTNAALKWAYNYLSGMKSLRLMEAGRLG